MLHHWTVPLLRGWANHVKNIRISPGTQELGVPRGIISFEPLTRQVGGAYDGGQAQDSPRDAEHGGQLQGTHPGSESD